MVLRVSLLPSLCVALVACGNALAPPARPDGSAQAVGAVHRGGVHCIQNPNDVRSGCAKGEYCQGTRCAPLLQEGAICEFVYGSQASATCVDGLYCGAGLLDATDIGLCRSDATACEAGGGSCVSSGDCDNAGGFSTDDTCGVRSNVCCKT